MHIYVLSKDLSKLCSINLGKVLQGKSRLPSPRAIDCLHPKKIIVGTLGS